MKIYLKRNSCHLQQVAARTPENPIVYPKTVSHE